MAYRRKKDFIDLFADFLFGAIFGGVVWGLGLVKAQGLKPFPLDKIGLMILAAAMIGGSLAALFRNAFWARYEKTYILPQVEEQVPIWGQVVLWTVLASSIALMAWVLLAGP